MTEAVTFNCSVCGAPAHAGAYSCHYCGAGIATLRCSHCFQMNMASAHHCSGCGSELGLLTESELIDKRCSECHIALELLKDPGGSVLHCRRCGGQFVEHAWLRERLEPREALGRAFTDAPYQKPFPKPTVERVHYRPCVVCQRMMNRKNFGGASGVIVDVCALHGTWFDAGELAQVLAFVQSGGLAREHAREEQRKFAERAQERALSGASSSLGPSTFDSLAQADADPASSFASDLWSFIVEVLTSGGPRRSGPRSIK